MSLLSIKREINIIIINIALFILLSLIDFKFIHLDTLSPRISKNKLPKVLIPVHLAGTSCDMSKIYSLSKSYGFSIIEDASHAIGGRYENEYVGSCKYSSITVFSFHPVKIITSGEGGVITTNNKNLASQVIKLRSHGIEKDPSKFIFDIKGSWNYEQHILGYNYRMTDIHAALGLSQLRRLDQIVKERNYQLRFYEEILEGLPLDLLKIPKSVYSSVHLGVVKLKKLCPKYYYDVFEGMRNNNIGVQLHYKPIYDHPFYRKFKFSKNQFKESEKYAISAISIPLYPGLTKEQQIKVKDTLKSLL